MPIYCLNVHALDGISKEPEVKWLREDSDGFKRLEEKLFSTKTKNFLRMNPMTDFASIIQHYPEMNGVHPAADLFPMMDAVEFAEP